jgi:hypothetical protein
MEHPNASEVRRTPILIGADRNRNSRVARPKKDRRTMMRDFNDFQFFAAVVVNHGFSAAARALGLPKSRVSRCVAC